MKKNVEYLSYDTNPHARNPFKSEAQKICDLPTLAKIGPPHEPRGPTCFENTLNQAEAARTACWRTLRRRRRPTLAKSKADACLDKNFSPWSSHPHVLHGLGRGSSTACDGSTRRTLRGAAGPIESRRASPQCHNNCSLRPKRHASQNVAPSTAARSLVEVRGLQWRPWVAEQEGTCSSYPVGRVPWPLRGPSAVMRGGFYSGIAQLRFPFF